MIQAKYSSSLAGLEQGYSNNYDFTDYTDPEAPCIFMGMYSQDDYDLFQAHKGKKFICLLGMDAITLDKDWDFTGTTIIASSKMIQRIIPEAVHVNVFAADTDYFNAPSKAGQSLLWYVGSGSPTSKVYYGEQLIEQIKYKIDAPIIQIKYGQYDKLEMFYLYRQSLLNLRLTSHDGPATMCLEAGLMGRVSIFNEPQPYALPYITVQDVIAQIKYAQEFPALPHQVNRGYMDLFEKGRNELLNLIK